MKFARGKNYREIKSKLYGDEDSILLQADFKNGCVTTNCGDFYFDYDIPFDDFIKFAKFIKKNRRRYGKMAQKLYKQIDYEAVKNGKCLIDLDTTIGIKCWKWAEKKAIADYIKGKWRFYGK